MPRDHSFEIHFLDHLVAILKPSAGHGLQAVEKSLGFLAAVGFDGTDDDIDAGFQLCPCIFQHGVGLADPGSKAEEDLELAAIFLGDRGQQRLGRGTAFIGGRGVGHDPPV